MLWPWFFFAGPAVLLLVWSGYLYLKYACSSVKLWKDEVLRAERRACCATRIEQDKLRELDARYRREEEAVRTRALLDHLATIPVGRLEEYPGIGPATVTRLREAGYRNLGQLRDFNGHVQGLGHKRLMDVASATRDLIAQAQARLKSGTGEEAAELPLALQSLKARLENDRLGAQTRLQSARNLVRDLEHFIKAARGITFFRYYLGRRNPLVDPQTLAEPLPDLDAALARGEGEGVKPGPDRPKGAGRRAGACEGSNPGHADSEGASDSPAQLLERLEIDPSAPVTADLIRRHFQLLSDRYAEAKAHAPDAEFARLAETRLGGIRQAAQQLLRSFGEELIPEPKAPAAQSLRVNADLDEIMGV
jgi:hypothetical protein